VAFLFKGLQMQDMGLSSKDASKEETRLISTPKFVEELAKEVLDNNKVVEMFQAMEIVSMKMDNLALKVKSFKTRLTIVKEEK
jgi:hypothetical protein